jgi:Na+/proline symporter
MDSPDFVISIFALLCGAVFFGGLIFALFWTYADAERRGKSGCLWLLIVWFTFPLGFIAYLLLRDQEVRL